MVYYGKTTYKARAPFEEAGNQGMCFPLRDVENTMLFVKHFALLCSLAKGLVVNPFEFKEAMGPKVQ